MNKFKRDLIINGGSALAMAILVFIGWMNYRYVTATSMFERWEHHTYAVSREFDELLLSLGDLETGERGFIITGQEKFLGPYRETLGRIDRSLERLQVLAKEDARHRNPMGGLEPLIREKLALAERTVELRKMIGFPAAYRVVVTERGKDLMDEIRRRVTEARAEEERLLESLRIKETDSLEKTFLMFMAGSIASVSLFLMVFLLLRREIAQHAGAEEEVRRHRDHLEELVQERTALLEQAKLAAEAASLAKSEFLANMSHEMRTPLTEIMGIIDLMLTDGLSDEQRRNLELARTAADSLKHLINDILDFSRLATGQMSFRMQPFDLRSCVHSVADIFSLRADRKGLRFLLEVDDRVPQRVVGDEGRLRQVLMNLVGNAVKFTQQGEIDVSVRPAPDPAHPEQVPLQFVIRDTGIGIPAEYMARVFEMFSQADSASTKKFSGTGLGLALSKQIVENLGGNIRVESRPGEGSIFSFTVPFVADHPEEV
jgi:signal transduction histidine kinase